MERLQFKRMLGIKRVFVVCPAPSSTSTHLKFILTDFYQETLRGKWQKKKEPKTDHPKFILTSAVPGQLPKLSIEYPLEPFKILKL